MTALQMFINREWVPSSDGASAQFAIALLVVNAGIEEMTYVPKTAFHKQ